MRILPLSEGGLLMRRKIFLLPICTVFAVTLTGCSAGDNAGENENTNTLESGYHSTEKDNLVRRISHDAPISRLGNQSTDQRGMFYQDNDYSRNDRNYHKHDGEPIKARSMYYTAYDGRLVENIRQKANKVRHVQDSRAVSTSNGIFLALSLDDYSQAEQVAENVRDEVQTIIGNRTLHIVANNNNFHSTINVDNRLRSGLPIDMSHLKVEDFYRMNHTPQNRE